MAERTTYWTLKNERGESYLYICDHHTEHERSITYHTEYGWISRPSLASEISGHGGDGNATRCDPPTPEQLQAALDRVAVGDT